MKPLRIFRHQLCEHPGYLAEYLDRAQVPWEMVCLDRGVSVPDALESISGLVFMGGNMSVNDPLDWIAAELRLIQRAREIGMPMLGICFGGQLIAKALGGQVIPNPRGMEVGWHTVKQTPGSSAQDWFTDLPAEFYTFHWHQEAFKLPPGAELLLENDCYLHQAYALDNIVGLQFHLEMEERMVKNWLHQYGSCLDHQTRCIQGYAEITRSLPERVRQLHQVADVLFGNWLRHVRQYAGG